MPETTVYDLDLKQKKATYVPNLAENKAIREKVEALSPVVFDRVRYRDNLISLWDDADKMMRNVPLAKKTESRADTASAVFSVAVDQLEAMTTKTIYDHIGDYRYLPVGQTSEGDMLARILEAEAMTEYLRISLERPESRDAIARCAHQFWKNGNAVLGTPWVEKSWDCSTWNGKKFKPDLEYVGPVLKFINLHHVYVDPDVDGMDPQDAVFIEDVITYTALKNTKGFVLPEDSTVEGLRPFLHDKWGEFREARENEQHNADMLDAAVYAVSAKYKYWEAWINLPIVYSNGGRDWKWDDDAPTFRHRVRMLGDPTRPHVLAIEPNIFPLGLPLLKGHAIEDNIGFYHMSLSQRIKTYYEQISIAQDQLIDTREKNNRRNVMYNPMDIPNMADYDFAAGQAIPVNGDPRTAFAEMDISDMTGTNLQHIQYSKLEAREALHVTDVVLGQALGGRTSASEAMQAHGAATAPIFRAIGRFEQAFIYAYMRKFLAYIQNNLKDEEFVAVLGRSGFAYPKYAKNALRGKYRIQANGVSNFATRQERFQEVQNIYQLVSQDPGVRHDELLKTLFENTRFMDPKRLVAVPSTHEATEDAQSENNLMLRYGVMQEVHPEDTDDVHEDIHWRGYWESEADEDVSEENRKLLVFHLQDHRMSKERKKASAAAGVTQLSSMSGQATAAPVALPPTPGEEQGQQISGDLGNIQGGSQIPLSA